MGQVNQLNTKPHSNPVKSLIRDISNHFKRVQQELVKPNLGQVNQPNTKPHSRTNDSASLLDTNTTHNNYVSMW